MLFDPDAGKTWEQLCETVWQRLTPEMKACLERLADVTGKTRNEIMREAHDECVRELDDPDSPFSQQLERKEFPCGRDPRLKKDERP